MSKNEITKNSRKKIIEFEKALISNADGVNIEGDGKHILTESKIAPIKHTFADGVYVRQMDLKKDSVVVGAIHKHLHVWFLLTGHISVATENTVEDYLAPCYVVSTPGVKRVILANEDSIFVNIHKNPSNTEDIDELEKEIVALNYKEYEQYINKKK
jgi:quercetin dioxygenase-like cupin family protein